MATLRRCAEVRWWKGAKEHVVMVLLSRGKTSESKNGIVPTWRINKRWNGWPLWEFFTIYLTFFFCFYFSYRRITHKRVLCYQTDLHCCIAPDLPTNINHKPKAYHLNRAKRGQYFRSGRLFYEKSYFTLFHFFFFCFSTMKTCCKLVNRYYLLNFTSYYVTK
jgi:hypothetical protein